MHSRLMSSLTSLCPLSFTALVSRHFHVYYPLSLLSQRAWEILEERIGWCTCSADVTSQLLYWLYRLIN